MTLHWWMHWFWVTLIHSVVTFPLLLPGTLSAPSQEGLHGIQLPVSSPPPIPGGGASWEAKAATPGGEEGFVATEKSATDSRNVSPPMLQIDHGGLSYVSPEGSVTGREGAVGGKENNSESNTEVPLFLEEENERIWGLDGTAPHPPFFLQSPSLGEVYEEDEDEGIHASDGMPWPPASVPRVEISSPSERPSVIPSHESPSSTVEPWPANKSLDHSSADAVHAREGKAIGVTHVDQQPKQEQKQLEVTDGSDVAFSITVSPTKVDVESSPVKSSSNSNATAVIVGKEDEEITKENVTLDSSGPVKDASSSNSDGKVVEVEEAGDARLPPLAVAEEEAKNDDEKAVVGGRNESGPTKINSSVVDKDGSNVEIPTGEEENVPPLEAPTAVAVREGSASDAKKERDGEVEASEKVEKDSAVAAADVPSSVHQGRMTAPRSLDTASIVGISLGSVLLVGAVAGGVGFVLYRRSLYANKPQTLNDKCSNPDSSGYIDDTLRVSSACSSNHGQRPMSRSRVEMSRNGGQGKRGGGRGGVGGGEGGRERRQSGAKENSEEMYSLDNDSFLNSLEAMTIQNYWTDSVKHTKL